MAEALIFGGSNGLVSKIADGLADVLGVRVRYQHSADETERPGVAICTRVEAFVGAGPMLVYADDEKPKHYAAEPARTASLGTMAEEIARGRTVAILASKAEARRWLEHIDEFGLATERPLKRLNLCGDAGSGKTTLAKELAEPLGLSLVSVDHLFWGDHSPGEKGESARSAFVDELLEKESWLAEGPYWRTAARLAEVADANLYLAISPEIARQRREARGDRPGPIGERIAMATRRAIPGVLESRVAGRLAEVAHLAPIFELRNDAEIEAITAGMLRGAALREPVADEPGGTA